MSKSLPRSLGIRTKLLQWLSIYLLTAVVFGLLDFVWLTQIGPQLYRPALDEILADQIRWAPALVFYVVYIFGIVWFAILPGVERMRVRYALLQGVLFGGIAYATFDLTNHATMKVWTTTITTLDIAWGATVTGATAAVTTAIWLKWNSGTN